MKKEESLKYYLIVFGLFNIFILAFIIPLFFGDFLARAREENIWLFSELTL